MLTGTRVNFTWPARLHLIVLGIDVRLYLTVRLFGWRVHRCWRRSGDPRSVRLACGREAVTG